MSIRDVSHDDATMRLFDAVTAVYGPERAATLSDAFTAAYVAMSRPVPAAPL